MAKIEEGVKQSKTRLSSMSPEKNVNSLGNLANVIGRVVPIPCLLAKGDNL